MCNWQIQEPLVKYLNLTSKEFIGEVDSYDEWSDGIEAEKIFVHTKSYDTFRRESTLFLFGRRGTGKSALVQMLDYEIRANKIQEYNYSRIINQEDAYHEFAIQIRNSPLRDSPQEELIYTLKKKWLWVIKVSGMLSLFSDNNIPEVKKLKIISYLKSSGLLKGKKDKYKPLNILAESLAAELDNIDYAPAKVGAAIYRLGKKLFNAEFEDAEEQLYELLDTEKKTAVVLIDSIERYYIKDKVSESVVASLIQAMLEIYHNRSDRLFVKAAFPSEILPHMSPSNWGKTDDKTHIIKWNFRDLTILLAKRYFKTIVKKSATEKEIDYYSEYDHSLNLLYKYFPEKITSRSNIDFDTISYIISHTQKKPRQLIFLVNAILTLAEVEKVDFFNLSEDSIIDGVHVLIDALFRETLHVYEQIYPKATQIVTRALIESESYFDYSELDVKLKEVNALLKNEAELSFLSKEDVKRLLLESGVLGIGRDKHKLANNKNILIALFEYQIKGVLTLHNNSLCVIHPMFFQVLRTNTDMNTFIYPKPSDEEDIELLDSAMSEN